MITFQKLLIQEAIPFHKRLLFLSFIIYLFIQNWIINKYAQRKASLEQIADPTLVEPVAVHT